MSIKIVVVLGLLGFLALFYSEGNIWKEIATGFFKIGTLPVLAGEDRNGNGILDPGEDWDRDGRLDVDESLATSSRSGRPRASSVSPCRACSRSSSSGEAPRSRSPGWRR
jgi:hypothetical protein